MTYSHEKFLGKKVKDVITGFEGTCTGFVYYVTGCNQALVVPRVKEDGSTINSNWFDEQRLEFLPPPPIKLDNSKTPGCDLAAPIR